MANAAYQQRLEGICWRQPTWALDPLAVLFDHLRLNEGLDPHYSTFIFRIIDPEITPNSRQPLLDHRSVLLHLVKAIDPNTVSFPTRSKMQKGQHFENINNFLRAAERVGVRRDELFSVPDLVDNHDWPKVIYCLQALADLANRRKFEFELQYIDDAELDDNLVQQQSDRLIQVLGGGAKNSADAGAGVGLGAAATNLRFERIAAAEKHFHERHEAGTRVSTTAQNLASAFLALNDKQPQVRQPETGVENILNVDAAPPGWIMVNFAICIICYFVYILFIR